MGIHLAAECLQIECFLGRHRLFSIRGINRSYEWLVIWCVSALQALGVTGGRFEP
jgi:hypothetical protein